MDLYDQRKNKRLRIHEMEAGNTGEKVDDERTKRNKQSMNYKERETDYKAW